VSTAQSIALTLFKERRVQQVRQLRSRIPVRRAELKTAAGQAGRAALREALRAEMARLASLEAMPPVQAAGMCPECANPAGHSPAVTVSLSDGSSAGDPCPAWPRWAQKVEMLHAELRKMSSRAAEPAAPVPRPIAVITAGGPVEDSLPS
jgi:hypothetical protein